MPLNETHLRTQSPAQAFHRINYGSEPYSILINSKTVMRMLLSSVNLTEDLKYPEIYQVTRYLPLNQRNL